MDESEIPGAQPAIGSEGVAIGLRVLEVALSHVVAADMDVPDLPLRPWHIIVSAYPQAAVGNGTADAHQRHGIGSTARKELRLGARRHAVAIQTDRLQGGAHGRKAHRERGLCQPVDREHRLGSQLRGPQALEELLAELHRDRLRAVEDEPHARQIEIKVGHRALAEHLQVMPVAEIGRAQNGRLFARGEGEPQERPAHEELGGHQMAVDAIGEHEDVKADQSHVVRERHPRKAHVVFGEVRDFRRAAAV